MKKTKIMLRDKSIDLKETKDLYGRLMILTKSSHDVDQMDAIGNYEFSLTPRALFAPNGDLLPCLDKSKLIHLLLKHGENNTVAEDQQAASALAPTSAEVHSSTVIKIAVVDAMVLVQKLL